MVSFWFEDEDAGGNNVRGGDRPRDSCNPLPLPVLQYIERYAERLDGQSYYAMRLAGDVPEIQNVRTQCMRDTGLCACIKR